MLEICKIIHPDTIWEFFQYLDNDGEGGDDCLEFTAKDQSCIQFYYHQPVDDEKDVTKGTGITTKFLIQKI